MEELILKAHFDYVKTLIKTEVCTWQKNLRMLSMSRGKEQQIIPVSSEDRFRGYGGLDCISLNRLKKYDGKAKTARQDEFTSFAIMRSDTLKAKVSGDIRFSTEDAKLPWVRTPHQAAQNINQAEERRF